MPARRAQAAARDRAARIRRQMRSPVAGIGTSRMPSGASASTSALATTGSAPTLPASPAPLTPSGLVLRRHRVALDVDRREMVRVRHGVVHERAGQVLPGIGIEIDLLHQHLADALGDAALDLAMQQERVHHHADVVHHVVAEHLDLAGLRDRSRARTRGSRWDSC